MSARSCLAAYAVRSNDGHSRTRGNPAVVRLQAQTKLVVQHDQVTVATAYDRLGHNSLHLLRDHANESLIASVVPEPIEAKAIVEIAEKRDVMFEHDIGAPTAATSSAATTPAAAGVHPRASTTATAH